MRGCHAEDLGLEDENSLHQSVQTNADLETRQKFAYILLKAVAGSFLDPVGIIRLSRIHIIITTEK